MSSRNFSKTVVATPIVEDVVTEMPVVDTEEAIAPVVEEKIDKFSSDYITGKVIAKALAVRLQPSIDSIMIRIVYADDMVKYKKVDNDWCELKEGGFCMRKFIQ